MDKIKTVKIKNPDGSVSEETYTISVDAKDVDMKNGKDLQDTIGDINVDRDGSIAEQLGKYKDYDSDIETLYGDVDDLEAADTELENDIIDLQINKINKTDIVDNLESTSATKVLSANQGKIIDDKLKQKAYFFNTVADMKAANLKNGEFACTLGYYAANDGGAADYKIVSSTDDYKETLNNGLFAELIIKDKINVDQFGAKGDNSTDDYNTIQSCITYAYNKNLVTEFSMKTYKISNTLKLYTNCVYNGNNCTIIQTSDVPVMANLKYFDKTQVGYHVVINDFYLEGDKNNSNNDGLILCGYYARVNNVTVRNIGGHGIVVTSYTIDGTEFSGYTMVEGMISNTKAYSYTTGKYPFYVHSDTIMITDWRLENCIFASDNCTSWMYFDRISGWYLTDVQCYGKATENGLYSKFASGAQIENLTLDGIMEGGLFIDSQIGSVNVTNVHINVHADATGSIYAIRQTGGSGSTNSLTVANVNVNIPNNTTPSHLYLHRGSGYIFDIVNPTFMKNHEEIDYKLYYWKGANDKYRLNGFDVISDTLVHESITNLAKHYNLEQYSGTSTTLTLTITPPAQIRNSALLLITGEVNGAERGSSIYHIGLMRRGTSQPVRLISEDSSYQFTNVGVTYNSTTNTYTIVATTPATSNCQYSMNVIY